ncbi:hypothetical protein [Microbulbifer pacificus]|uniref:hypothetical protein n=1 Tax=Microbulbifer pacificus TaxID=407164 RepID=UPI000CF45E35|nr:hypothetical protein [Microbulbifer pacificus]
MYRNFAVLIALFVAIASPHVIADADLAKKLSNPVSDLISVPFQNNWDNRVGPMEGGRKYPLNLIMLLP